MWMRLLSARVCLLMRGGALGSSRGRGTLFREGIRKGDWVGVCMIIGKLAGGEEIEERRAQSIGMLAPLDLSCTRSMPCFLQTRDPVGYFKEHEVRSASTNPTIPTFSYPKDKRSNIIQAQTSYHHPTHTPPPASWLSIHRPPHRDHLQNQLFPLLPFPQPQHPHTYLPSFPHFHFHFTPHQEA